MLKNSKMHLNCTAKGKGIPNLKENQLISLEYSQKQRVFLFVFAFLLPFSCVLFLYRKLPNFPRQYSFFFFSVHWGTKNSTGSSKQTTKKTPTLSVCLESKYFPTTVNFL